MIDNPQVTKSALTGFTFFGSGRRLGLAKCNFVRRSVSIRDHQALLFSVERHCFQHLYLYDRRAQQR
jgi:hypothetical protein